MALTVGTIKYKNGSNWIDVLHPVGSFYFSTSSTSPASLFGGTWVQITGAVIRGNNSAPAYGGSDTHTMTVSEMPSHTHTVTLNSSSDILFTSGSYVQATSASGWYATAPTDWGSGLKNTNTGGGRHSRNCRVITTAIFGIGASKQIRGGR